MSEDQFTFLSVSGIVICKVTFYFRFWAVVNIIFWTMIVLWWGQTSNDLKLSWNNWLLREGTYIKVLVDHLESFKHSEGEDDKSLLIFVTRYKEKGLNIQPQWILGAQGLISVSNLGAFLHFCSSRNLEIFSRFHVAVKILKYFAAEILKLFAAVISEYFSSVRC